jgi:hypothetical protein
VTCETCGDAQGESLALRGEGTGDPTPRVLTVHCRCTNHNRCAGCGDTLHERRLSAWQWDETARSARYVAAYLGLGHRCRRDPDESRDRLLSRRTPRMEGRIELGHARVDDGPRRSDPGGQGA